MLCKLWKAGKLSPRIQFLPLSILKLALLALLFLAVMPAPVAVAQITNFDSGEGEISGTVLFQANQRPASQVAVSLKSRVAGIFRSVLTDIEGHFRVQHLPHGTYEVAIEEEGYEAARTSTQLDGQSSKLVVYLRSAKLSQNQKAAYTVSLRELKIPSKAQNEFQKGLERLANHDPAGSLKHFTKATQAFPGYYEAYYHLGVAQMRLGHIEEAEKEYQESIDLSGGHYSWADFALGFLLCQQGKPTDAERIVRRGLEVDDGAAEGYTILSDALMQQNRRDEAEKSAQEALLRNPNLADAYLMLANVDADKGDYRAQLQHLDAYLKLAPNGPAVEQVRKGREVILRILAKNQPKD